MNKKEEERRARLMQMREQRLPGIKKAHDEKMQQKKGLAPWLNPLPTTFTVMLLSPFYAFTF